MANQDNSLNVDLLVVRR